MEELRFVKDYKDQELLRSSFNELAMETFGIQFETWYKAGYWTEKYNPYSFAAGDKIVANVSVNLVNLVINNEIKQAVQIGTVMTAADFRNKGLSRQLLEKVLDEFKHMEFIYLFANHSVLGFYPKFGFVPVDEVQFSVEYNHQVPERSAIRRLDVSNKEELEFVRKLAAMRCPNSTVFSALGTEELLMFYCLMVFPNDIYYIEGYDAVVIFQKEGEVLHLYDVITREKIKVSEIVRHFADESIKKIVFHFHPRDDEWNPVKNPYKSSTVLFVKKMASIELPEEMKHPITSQA